MALKSESLLPYIGQIQYKNPWGEVAKGFENLGKVAVAYGEGEQKREAQGYQNKQTQAQTDQTNATTEGIRHTSGVKQTPVTQRPDGTWVYKLFDMDSNAVAGSNYDLFSGRSFLDEYWQNEMEAARQRDAAKQTGGASVSGKAGEATRPLDNGAATPKTADAKKKTSGMSAEQQEAMEAYRKDRTEGQAARKAAKTANANSDPYPSPLRWGKRSAQSAQTPASQTPSAQSPASQSAQSAQTPPPQNPPKIPQYLLSQTGKQTANDSGDPYASPLLWGKPPPRNTQTPQLTAEHVEYLAKINDAVLKNRSTQGEEDRAQETHPFNLEQMRLANLTTAQTLPVKLAKDEADIRHTNAQTYRIYNPLEKEIKDPLEREVYETYGYIRRSQPDDVVKATQIVTNPSLTWGGKLNELGLLFKGKAELGVSSRTPTKSEGAAMQEAATMGKLGQSMVLHWDDWYTGGVPNDIRRGINYVFGTKGEQESALEQAVEWFSALPRHELFGSAFTKNEQDIFEQLYASLHSGDSEFPAKAYKALNIAIGRLDAQYRILRAAGKSFDEGIFITTLNDLEAARTLAELRGWGTDIDRGLYGRPSKAESKKQVKEMGGLNLEMIARQLGGAGSGGGENNATKEEPVDYNPIAEREAARKAQEQNATKTQETNATTTGTPPATKTQETNATTTGQIRAVDLKPEQIPKLF
ncbi:MAG: hypothetical protein LBO72_09645 [Helicobacteraceae bacterium]|jgi:hypothetical protein|nr:hypothetical protein [Helicobacteraceae bacterium]